MAKPRADRVMAELIEGAERPMPSWIRKKQPAKVMLASRIASVDSQTGSVVNARDSLAASQSVASVGTMKSQAQTTQASVVGTGAAKNAAPAEPTGSVAERIKLDKDNVRKHFKKDKAKLDEALRKDRRVRARRSEDVRSFPHQLRALPVSKFSAVARYAVAKGSRKRWIEDDLNIFLESESTMFDDGEADDMRASGGLLASADDDVFMTQTMKQQSSKASIGSSPVRGNQRQAPELAVSLSAPDLEPATESVPLSKEAKELEQDLRRLRTISKPGFLKIDDSDMPIEIFDSLEAEEKDKAPERWLRRRANGKLPTAVVPYYRNGWKWKNCEVVGYDEETKKFTVRIAATSKTEELMKSVSRLNICFDKENTEDWRKRRDFALGGRERAKERLRYDFYISKRSGKEVTPIQRSWLRNIQGLVSDGLPPRIPFPEKGTNSGALLRSLIKGGISDFVRCMKKAAVAHEVSVNPERLAEYDSFKLPKITKPPPPPQLGKVVIPSSSSTFASIRRAVGRKHYTNSEDVVNGLKFQINTWCAETEDCMFMDTALDNLELPCNLEELRLAQRSQCVQLTSRLQKKWRHLNLEKLVDELQEVFDFFEDQIEVYQAGPLRRFIRHIELRMSSSLRNHVMDSLASWLEFLDEYTTDREGKFAPDKGLVGRPPLLKIELGVQATDVITIPSMKDIQVVLSQAVHDMVSSVHGIDSLEAEIMSLFQFPKRVLLNICRGDETLQGVDQMITGGLGTIEKAVERAMGPVQLLMERYQEFAYIMEIDEEKMVASFVESQPPPGAEALEAKIREFHTIVQTVNMSTRHDEEYFQLVKVDTAGLKRALVQKATLLRSMLCDHVMFTERERLQEIGELYKSMLARVKEKPKNETELRDLKVFIKDSNDIILDTVEEVAQIHKRLDALSEFGALISRDDSELKWSTMLYPQKVEKAYLLKQEEIETDQVKFLDKLNLEKEKFDQLIEKFHGDVERSKSLDDYVNQAKVVEDVNDVVDALAEAVLRGDNFNDREAVFELPPTEYPILGKLQREIEPFSKLWNTISDFHTSSKEWLLGDFTKLDAESITNQVEEWWKTSFKMSKTLEGEFPGPAKCAASLREDTTVFKEYLPVVNALATPALKERHWEALSELLGSEIVPDSELTLKALLDLKSLDHIEKIQEICVKAEKEYSLERSLLNMKGEWLTMDFEVKAYKSSGTFVVGGIDDIITLLDDHMVKTQTMRQSIYIGAIEKDARMWEKQLRYAQNLIEEWIACQKAWMYLEPIFSSDDIMRQLPTEARRFNDVDKTWRKILAETNEDPNYLVQAHPEKGLCQKFKMANEKLDLISKGLSDYLEVKRLYFPRFFFLSADQLIEILSQTKDPTAVQPHLNKAFEGITQVKFEDDLKITEMISQEMETVKLLNFVDPETPANKGNVERWLLILEKTQWNTVRDQVERSQKEFPTILRTEWMVRWPAQVILLVSQIFWTRDVGNEIKERGTAGIRAYAEKWDEEINKTVKAVQEMGNANITKLERKLRMKTLGALTVIDVHARETMDKMVKVGVSDIADFEWVSQLRYYWEEAWQNGQACKKGDPTAVARIVNARCLYGYEYLGNSMRLVITPLTDRCYRTMISAVDLLYGGAPEGPAGTGKTETVKDLSKAVAIQCVVFNCSDGLDYLAMAKFFKGLAGCGSWCCFDEFNRINVEVLSVIAQQILVITKAKKERKEKFHFEGTYMKLNLNCNVFITMNPGYAGRTALPDNLKALFRPCAMMVPDYALIGEIRLYSFGFVEAKSNAKKLVCVLQLSSEQLSSQKHYDYGMRAVNSILVAAGELRQALGGDPEWNESMIVLRAIMDVNLPKFTVEDLPLFRGITSDLFPGITLPQSDYGSLTKTIKQECVKGITVAPDQTYVIDPVPSFVTKIIELFEMICVRWGVMVVGETGSGKSSTIRALSQSMQVCAENGDDTRWATQVAIYPMNPKSVNMGQLYGSFDENTHEWSDGILAIIFRNCAFDTTPARQWMLFDGPVDAIWIESMNTVLDDNKKLCLTSGEIIKMTDRMTLMFEAEDLEQASPATVSRVGMIFCEERNIGWRPLRKVWLDSMYASETMRPYRQVLSDLFDWLLPPLTFFTQKRCTIPSPVTPQEMTYSVIRLMTCLLANQEDWAADMVKILENCFIFSLVWSVGACTDAKGRATFDAYLRAVLKNDLEANEAHIDFLSKNRTYKVRRKAATQLPAEGLLYDYKFDPRAMAWEEWLAVGSKYSIAEDAAFNSIVVPTIDTTRNEWLVTTLLKNGYHVMCTGETGTGKTVAIKNHDFVNGSNHSYVSIVLNFSAQTGSNATQDIIDSKLDKRRKGVTGPPLGTQCVIFVDDLNMPAKEEYGAQPPIEILRQWMDHSGWYNRAENSFVQLLDLQFIGAMGPPVGGRSRITQRYTRHFNSINFVPFDNKSLRRVFNTIMNWFVGRGFSKEIKITGKKMVKATIDLYDTLVGTLLPTPTKSHYTFNLRDLAKVFQGVAQVTKDTLEKSTDFVSLWCHECLRVFHDRLTTVADRQYFDTMLGEKVQEHFNMDYKAKIKPENVELLYCNFSDPKIVTKKPYVLMDDPEQLEKVVNEYLDEFNAMSKKPMALVLFSNALEHVCRISRIINQPYGNALLVGVGGSGRKSLSTLATFIADFKQYAIALSRVYGMFEWREDLKKIFLLAGMQNEPTVFLFDDTQIIDEAFLEDVNGILNTGEVPNLFNSEEMIMVTEGITRDAKDAGVNTGSHIEMMNFFTERVRNNLHVVLCLSPIGDAFRTRLRMFPALVNCCTIDWFTAWPEEALRTVAKYFLDSIDLPEEVRGGLIDVCVNMQTKTSEMAERFTTEMNRYYYVTPTSYLELISTFKGLLGKSSDNVTQMIDRYDNGLKKISETQEQVDVMKRELVELQPKLADATVATDKLLVQIKADTIEANAIKAVVTKDEQVCLAQTEEANDIKASCEADLAEAMPALNSAVKALNSLKASDFDELKGMKVPSKAVVMVMTALCPMLGVKAARIKDPKDSTRKIDSYWEAAKGKEMLGNGRELLKKMIHYDKDDMDPDMVEKVTKQTENPDFNPEFVKKGSVACAGVCSWIKAMMLYDRVARVVRPKKEALAEAEASLAEATASLQEKQAMLKEVMDKLEDLQSALGEANERKKVLADQVRDCEVKLDRASKLINGLSGEKGRWGDALEALGKRFKNITGDIMLSSGQIAYTGVFVIGYRNEMLKGWAELLERRQITCSEPFSLRETLGQEVEIREWVINKLPNDMLSIDNAIMMEQSNRWPLMIDPQGQANKWIKCIYKDNVENQLVVLKQNNPTFVRNMEMGIQFGSPVLLENVPEFIDPILEQVLTKQIVTQGGIQTVQLGDNAVEFDPKFKLYITTKLMNPHYPPELCVKVNLLNFMATAEGLEDQMLGQVVAREEPKLEAQREQLVLDDAANQKELQQIEDTILRLLKEAKGNILEDEVLIQSLNQSKKTSDLIGEKVKQGQKTKAFIAKTRDRYQSVGFHVSQLFFCIADLASVDPMYQYSLEWYINLFNLAIDNAEKDKDPAQRTINLNDTFTYTLYVNVCRSLFAKDKLLFSFLLTTKIMLGQGTLEQENLTYLLQGNIAMDLDRPNPMESGSWLTDKMWGEILALSKLKSFEGIDKDLEATPAKYRAVFETIDAAMALQEMVITDDAGRAVSVGKDRYTTFERLCILRAIRPDVCVPMIQTFITEEIGEKFIDPPPFDLMTCYKESSCTTPLVFVLTPGAAPMDELFKLADEVGFSDKLTSMSLGQGQGTKAEHAISEAQHTGKWVCLENCHLCVSWMPTLERICEELSPERVESDFRLWLTSNPSKAFPGFVLQNGVKMTNEPPKGIKANLAISYANISEDFLMGNQDSLLAGTRRGEFKKLLFSLCFFHAHLRERLKFGPLGFNNVYVFSQADQNITMAQLQIYLEALDSHDDVPYQAISYLAGECNYGGRVTDDKDRRTLMNILTDFYTPSVQSDDYRFSPSGTYFAPPDGTHESYMEYIKSLPYHEGPEVFGLHDNANTSFALAETDALLSTALSLQPKSGGASGGDGQSWDSLISGVADDITARLPASFDIEKALLDFPTMYEESMNTVITQELMRFNKLTTVITKSLAEMKRALAGLIVLGGELEAMGNSIAIGQVPKIWMDAAYPSLKPLGSWVFDLIARLNFLRGWVDALQKPNLYWISGFYFTQAFLTGTLQNFARKYRIPIDEVAFDFKVLRPEEQEAAPNQPPEDGAVIHGLFLDSARFDVGTHCLAEALPRELFAPVPHIHMLPRQVNDLEPVEGTMELYTVDKSMPPYQGGTCHVYLCPVYKTSVRYGVLSTTGHSTNFVIFIRVPMAAEHEQKHWIKRGVAMLTQLDD